MAKQKFERTKPHVNIGTIGHVDMVRLPSPQLSPWLFPRKVMLLQCAMTKSTRHPKRRLVV